MITAKYKDLKIVGPGWRSMIKNTFLSSFERTIGIVPFSFRDPIIQNPQETQNRQNSKFVWFKNKLFYVL